jgi:hypothetical protein
MVRGGRTINRVKDLAVKQVVAGKAPERGGIERRDMHC